jgi:hypothetical protein
MGAQKRSLKPDQKKIREAPSFTKHVYDIEIFGIIDDLRKKYSDGAGCRITPEMDNTAFFGMLEERYVRHLKSKETNISKNLEYRHYILPSTSELYYQSLAWKILTIYTDEIDALLSYQAENYYEAKEKFCELVEHHVRGFVRANNYLKETAKLDEIKIWLKDNRIFKAMDKSKMPDKEGFQSGLTTAQRDEKSSQLKEWILPDCLEKFTEIEKELFKRGFIDTFHKWHDCKTKRNLVEFLCVIVNYKYFRPIVRDKKIKDFHKRQFISERYGFGKTGLTETWKKTKPKIESAIIPFFWIERAK